MLNGHSITKAADWCIKLPSLRQRNIARNCLYLHIHMYRSLHMYYKYKQITECMKCGVKMLSVWCILDKYETHTYTVTHTPHVYLASPFQFHHFCI